MCARVCMSDLAKRMNDWTKTELDYAAFGQQHSILLLLLLLQLRAFLVRESFCCCCCCTSGSQLCSFHSVAVAVGSVKCQRLCLPLVAAAAVAAARLAFHRPCCGTICVGATTATAGSKQQIRHLAAILLLILPRQLLSLSL